MMKSFHVAIALSIAAIGMSGGTSSAEELVNYPEGYRNWTHVKSMVIQPGHELHEAFGGIHHIYANQDAVEGYQTGRFSDGAILVFDLLEAVEEENAITEGPRKVLGVMEKDRTRFAETGGWGLKVLVQAKRTIESSGKMPRQRVSNVIRLKNSMITYSANGENNQIFNHYG